MNFSRFALGLSVALATPAGAADFAKYAFDYFDRHGLAKGERTNPATPDAEVPLAKFDEGETKAVLDLYRASLPSKATRWTTQTILSGYTLPQAPTGARFDNETLVRAYDGKRLLGTFRPVATTTGCDSGCLPVVFHLSLTDKGQVKAILEDPRSPLTKIHHQPLSAAEKKKLLSIARELPKGLDWIDGNAGLADARGAFPPSTWSPLRGSLVEGAAYTSYRVYEASLGARLALSKAARSARDKELDAERTEEGTWLRAANPEELRKRLFATAEAVPPPVPTPALRAAYRHVGPAIAWLGSQDRLSLKEANDLLGKLGGWQRERRADLMSLYRELLRTPRTRPWVAAFLAQKTFPFEPENLRRLYAELASAQAPTLAPEDWLTEDLAGDPGLLTVAIERNRDVKGREDLVVALEATRALRYPRLDAARAWLRSPAAASKKGREASAKAAELERNRWRQKLAPTPRPFPKLQARNASDAKIVELPRPDPVRLYVFFAAWCPHCLETVGKWSRAGWKESTWKRVQLVEIHPGDRSVADFCKETQLPAEVCGRIVKLGDLRQSPEVQAVLGVEGIPYLIATNGRGQIRFENLRLPSAEGADPERELLTALEVAEP